MMSDVQRDYIISRCTESKCPFIFVTETLNPSYLKELPSLKPTFFEAAIDLSMVDRNHSRTVSIMFRLMRLLFGSLMKLKYIEYIEQEKLERLYELLQEQAPAVNISPIVLDEVISLAWKLSSSPLQAVSLAELQSPEDFPSFYEYIVRLCYLFLVTRNERGSDCSLDISFQRFSLGVPLTQFLSQQDRIEAWLRTVILPQLGLEIKLSITDKFKKRMGWFNVHSHHLMAFMRSAKDARQQVEAPSYSFIPRDSSLNLEELLLQQSIQKNELDWNAVITDWKIFPHSLNYLMDLLLVYPFQLKILFSMSPITLYHTLENATKERYDLVLPKLEALLTDPQLVKFVCLLHLLRFFFFFFFVL
jgi:hypothetical protein